MLKALFQDQDETRQYVIQTISDFLDGTDGEWDWDDFISCPLPYPELNDVRLFCSALPFHYPRSIRTEYCSPEGIDALKSKLAELTGRSSSPSSDGSL